MRSALRTSIVTAALAGALLAPAATAVAAPAVQSATTSVSGTVSDNDRYAGEPVYIGEGLVAVLRNGPEGPEAWIRAVGEQWKPGDVYMVRVLTVLDRSHTGDTVKGLSLKLTKLDTGAPVLTVTKDGAAQSFPLPKAGTPRGPEAPKTPVTPAPEDPKSPETPKTPATPATTAKDRYAGELVLVGKGRLAVLRGGAEGPEVWIRAVSENWKPADGWAGRVLATLTPSAPPRGARRHRLQAREDRRRPLRPHRPCAGRWRPGLLPAAGGRAHRQDRFRAAGRGRQAADGRADGGRPAGRGGGGR
ncbi:hypothetical protein AB0D97_07510 [Streptomyces roseus]|uniref:hypothetical protein n=1 Tax=Streptomyces roseus TaxID=66430 RepID=UPI0033DC42AA